MDVDSTFRRNEMSGKKNFFVSKSHTIILSKNFSILFFIHN
jgi:hypothetical protein